MAILEYMPTAKALNFNETTAHNQFEANREMLIGNYDRTLTKPEYASLFLLLAAAGNRANWPSARELNTQTGHSVESCQTVIDEVIAGGKEYKRLNP